MQGGHSKDARSYTGSYSSQDDIRAFCLILNIVLKRLKALGGDVSMVHSKIGSTTTNHLKTIS